MTFNVGLAHKALVWINNHPDEWNQSSWRCQTGMCFAGIVDQIAGGKWVIQEPTDDRMVNILLIANQADEDAGLSIRYHGTERVVTAANRASRLLGIYPLNPLDIDLFHSGNTLEDLERYVDAYAAESEGDHETAQALIYGELMT
jgi:hypothetical protein